MILLLKNYNDKTGENTVKMYCGIVDTVGRIKKSVQEEFILTPAFKHLRMRLVRSGSIIPDETPLCDILARTTAAWNVDFVMESSDPSRLPIRIIRSDDSEFDDYSGYEDDNDSESYPKFDPEKSILTVQILDKAGNQEKLVTVQIVQSGYKKPFLGGYKILPQDIEYHHAAMQTEKIRKTGDSIDLGELVNRGSQTHPRFSKVMQTPQEISTQTQVPGIYISGRFDRILEPSGNYIDSIGKQKAPSIGTF